MCQKVYACPTQEIGHVLKIDHLSVSIGIAHADAKHVLYICFAKSF